MSRRGESNEEELSIWIAKARIRLPPILAVLESFGFLLGNVLAPLHKPRAEAAMDDALLKLVELSHPVLMVAGERLHHPIEKIDQVLVEFRCVLQIAHMSGLADDVELRSGDLPLHGF
jgi:hypothetical protein